MSSSKAGRCGALLGIVAIDLDEAVELRAAIAAPGLAFDPLAVAQVVAAADFGGDEDVVRMLREAALRVAEKAEAFAGDFDDAFGYTESLPRSGRQ